MLWSERESCCQRSPQEKRGLPTILVESPPCCGDSPGPRCGLAESLSCVCLHGCSAPLLEASTYSRALKREDSEMSLDLITEPCHLRFVPVSLRTSEVWSCSLGYSAPPAETFPSAVWEPWAVPVSLVAHSGAQKSLRVVPSSQDHLACSSCLHSVCLPMPPTGLLGSWDFHMLSKGSGL